jgi:Ca2+-binding RTX toxin-like protein
VRRGLVNLCLVLLFSVVGATPATAAVTVSRGGTLDITGTAASETVTLTAGQNTITVASPQGVEGVCGIGPEVACAVDPNLTVRAELGGGEDTLAASTLARAMSVRASDGADTVTTGAGDDSIVLEGDDNEVHAGAGRDVVAATGVVRGGGGGDFLSGDGDLDGGPGDDALEAILGATLAGGDGYDSARFTLAGPVRISLDGVANDGALVYESNVGADVEVLKGGAADDVLIGTAGAQELDGGPGPDALTGGSGADVLRGGDGDDALDGADGDIDDADCGAGDDRAHVDVADRTTGCEQVDAVPTPTPTPDPSPTPTPTPDPSATPEPSPVLDAVAVAVSAVTTAAAIDAPPVLRVSLTARVARERFLRRGVVASVRCSESCTVSSVLTLDSRTAKRLKLPRRLARAAGTLTRAGTVRVTVKPNASVRRRLTRVKRTVNFTLTTTAIDSAGHARTVTRRLRLSR